MAATKSLFLAFDADPTDVPAWLERVCEEHRGSPNLDILELVLTNPGYTIPGTDAGALYPFLDEVEPYFSCFDHVWFGTNNLGKEHVDPYNTAMNDPAWRWHVILVQRSIANQIAQRYANRDLRWYVSYEAGLDYWTDSTLVGVYDAYLRQHTADLYSLRPASIMWSPAFGSHYDSSKRATLVSAMSQVFNGSQFLTHLALQDAMGRSSPLTCADNVQYQSMVRDARPALTRLVDMELFQTAGNECVNGDPSEHAAREACFDQNGLSVGPSFEIRYWFGALYDFYRGHTDVYATSTWGVAGASFGDVTWPGWASQHAWVYPYWTWKSPFVAASRPAAVFSGSDAAGQRQDVFVRDSVGALWQRSWSPSGLRDFRSLGGTGFSFSPAATSWGRGRLDLFAVTGGTSDIYHRYSSDYGAHWSLSRPLPRPSGSQVNSSPAAASWGDGRIDVFARTSDGNIRQLTFESGAWRSEWVNIGGTGIVASVPADVIDADAPAAGQLHVVALGPGGAVWERRFADAAWGPWLSLGGSCVSAPSLTTTSYRADALVSELPATEKIYCHWTDGRVYSRRYNGSSSSPWAQDVAGANLSAAAGTVLGIDAVSYATPTPLANTSASYDPLLRVPQCGLPMWLCDSGSSDGDGLVVGRDSLVGGSEPHQPNVLGSACSDGSQGAFHSDESVDRIRVYSLDGTPLSSWKNVRIDVKVWAWQYPASDHLDLYAAADAMSPNWSYLGTMQPVRSGAQWLSMTYNLPRGSLQAIRANFRYLGSPAVCTTGAYDDHDDLVFAVQDPVLASFDAGLRTPKCASAGSSCDSGTLLVGRGAVGPEANAPNTLMSACSDGNSGVFHADESLDRLVVGSLDGLPMRAGAGVRVDASVWAYSQAEDFLDLYHTANVNSPSWVYLTTLVPTAIGSQVMSATFTLPSSGLQAIRGSFRFRGSSIDPCPSGSYNDHDDLVFIAN